ncbi:hypothetical protein CR969_02795 [Candidatus Saccharibacteria bacterium]|nr:MAG: hypothetical protein CR969_02795 [Candidatus Saccharibacteria bacterium]
MKHILIIGGMGPQASIYAHRKLIENYTKAHQNLSNQDYPRITHLSINVRDFISDPGAKDEARGYILECLSQIDLSSVDAGFVACNTAHLLFDDIQEATGGKLISLIDNVKDYLAEAGEDIGIVATPSTIDSKLYGDIARIEPDRRGLDNINQIIRGVIAGGELVIPELLPALKSEIDKLKDEGADKVILGCSELSMFGERLDSQEVIDPIELMVCRLVE